MNLIIIFSIKIVKFIIFIITQDIIIEINSLINIISFILNDQIFI